MRHLCLMSILMITLAACAPASQLGEMQDQTVTDGITPESTATPIPTSTNTPTAAPTLTATPTEDRSSCFYEIGASQQEIFASAGGNYVETLPAGTRVRIANPPIEASGALWYEIVYRDVFEVSRVGWIIIHDDSGFTGRCTFLNRTPPPTPMLPTPQGIEHIDFVINLPIDIGSILQFSQTLPVAETDGYQQTAVHLDHLIEINADLPNIDGSVGVRWATYELSCEGGERWMRWRLTIDDFDEIPSLRCGERAQEPISATKKHYIHIAVPEGSGAITYTLTITVSEYSP